MRRSSADPAGDGATGDPATEAEDDSTRGAGGDHERETSAERGGDRPGRERPEESSSEPFDLRGTLRFVFGTVLFAAVEKLSSLYRRDPSLWVFGARGGEAFVDNAKYLYLHAVEERPEVRPVWLSKDASVVERLQAAGYEAYHARSPRGIYYNLRAGVVCLTQDVRDVNMACSGGATIAQLWHGIPIKRIGWDAEIPGLPLPVRLCLGHLARRVDPLVLTARELSNVFASGQRVPRENMVVGGYPRTEALRGAIPGEDVGIDPGIADLLDLAADSGPLLFYLPTYREGDDESFDRHLDLDALEEFLERRDAHLAVKSHPKETPNLAERTGPRVIEVPPGNDAYPLIRRADVLVTDYSSILFDYLLLDRPVAFYPYDLARYRDERGFYYDYETVTPGPVATDFEELLAALEGILDGDDFAGERAAVRDRFFDHHGADQAALTYRVLAERVAGDR